MRKFVVLILFITVSLFGLAQVDGFPQYEFKSTSSYQYTTPQRQYTVPVAAYDLQTPGSQGPRKAVMSEEKPGYDPADPGWENVPVGDPDIFTITFLLILYFCCHYLKIRKSQMLLLNIQKQ